MTKLLKHYWVDRDNPNVYATTPEQFLQPMFGTITPNIPGLEIIHRLTDENGVEFCLSTCPDETTVQEVNPGLVVITQQQWDTEISSYDIRQQTKRYSIVRKHRDQLLDETDWLVIRSVETGINLSTEFNTWRQSLRDIPDQQIFPIELPIAPNGVVVTQSIYDTYQGDLRSITMINDPLPAPPPNPEDQPFGIVV